MVFSLQLEKIKRNPVTFFLVALIASGTIFCGYLSGNLVKSIAYVIAMWVCSLLIDWYALRNPSGEEIMVKKPGKETFLIALYFLLAFIFLYFRYMAPIKWEDLNVKIKLLLVPILFLFVFPLGLTITLFVLRYKLKDLGIRFSGLLIAIPVIAIIAVTGLLFAPHDFTFSTVYEEEGGLFGLLVEGFIIAGLLEEFWRFIAQTRFAAFLKNKGLGWFIATVLWALMHVPTFYNQGHSITDAFLGALSKIPLGLLWGYMTIRTKSIWPSVLVHGMNMWGLQNV